MLWDFICSFKKSFILLLLTEKLTSNSDIMLNNLIIFYWINFIALNDVPLRMNTESFGEFTKSPFCERSLLFI